MTARADADRPSPGHAQVGTIAAGPLIDGSGMEIPAAPPQMNVAGLVQRPAPGGGDPAASAVAPAPGTQTSATVPTPPAPAPGKVATAAAVADDPGTAVDAADKDAMLAMMFDQPAGGGEEVLTNDNLQMLARWFDQTDGGDRANGDGAKGA